MAASVTIAWCLTVGALFDVYTAPATDTASAFFVKGSALSDFCVLEGRTLTVYGQSQNDAPVSIEFDDGVSAFDVADVDSDGKTDVIAVCGTRIVRYAISDAAAERSPQTMFEASSVFADDAGNPAPRVLVVPFEGRNVLALPFPDALEMRSIDGTVLTRFAYKKESPESSDNEQPWMWANPPQVGPAGSLEVSVWETRKLDPDLPEGVPRLDKAELPYQRVWTQKGREETDWESFPLRRDGNDKRGIFCNRRLRGGTRLALADLGQKAREVSEEDLGPKRQYPGLLVWSWGDDPDDLPDFNGDGYTDILLGRMPEYQISVDAVTRIASDQSWPVRLTVHLFSPEKDRHDPKPAARLEFRVPVMAFLSFNPVENIVTRDFDGDGRTDVACSTDERTYSVWLYHVRPEVGDIRPAVGTDGFSKEPDFTYTSPEAIHCVYARAKIDDSGRTSLVLRGEKMFHVLRPSLSEP